MKQQSLPTYLSLRQALNKTDPKLHPSQVHGLICGILCSPMPVTYNWQALITGGKETEKMPAVLQELYDISAKHLAEFLFELQLVLPGTTELLALRAEALTLWCQGFLTGLKLVDIPLVDRPAGEMTEAINDLVEIAKMNYEEVIASEEDEVAFTELVEYVRIAVILIYQEAKGVESNEQLPASSSHSMH